MQETELLTPHLLSFENPVQSAHTSWQPLLEKCLSAQARETACIVAQRMRDPAVVDGIAAIANSKALFPSPRVPTDLAWGNAGLALMYCYLDACLPSQGFDDSAQQYLRSVADSTQQAALLFPSPFNGTAGLALILSQASQGGRRYQKTLAHLHEGLCEQILTYPWRRPETAGGVASSDFDIISGAAGVLAYLVSIGQTGANIHHAIAHLLDYLLWLGEPGQLLGQERWYIPPDLLPNEQHRHVSPRGNFNCGLAHGIPGPLAALSLTWLAGYRYPGLRETIAYLAEWVMEHRLEQEWGVDWPDSIPLEKAKSAQDWQLLSPTRSGWCYGAPGIARSLWLAGCALQDEELCRKGIEAIEATLRKPIPRRSTPAPTLCHGMAGLLHICLRFAHECESELVRAHIPILTEQILATFDASFPLGFRDIDQGIPLDQPGWLTGAPGVVMVLLAAATDVAPNWDRALAIA